MRQGRAILGGELYQVQNQISIGSGDESYRRLTVHWV